MVGSIYFVINKLTGKYYIGQTTQKVSDRWRDHKRFCKTNNNYFARAIRKYGEDSFEIRTIFTCYDRNTLDEAEQYFISFLSSNNKNFGYNCTPGGKHFNLSKEHKQKIGVKLLGKKRSKEFSNKMKLIASRPEIKKAKSAAWKGKKRGEQSLEHREKNRLGHSGKKHTEEARSKMKEVWRRRKLCHQRMSLF